MDRFSLDIEQQSFDEIVNSLQSAVDDSVKTEDANFVGAQIMAIINLRSSRGKYLDKPTGGTSRKRTYKSESHKKKRAKLGLPIDRVTLFMGKVGVLEALRVRGFVRGADLHLEVGYISGLSEDRASEIAGYLTDQGAGKNKVLYRFLGLTKTEEGQVIGALSPRIGANIQSNFNL